VAVVRVADKCSYDTYPPALAVPNYHRKPVPTKKMIIGHSVAYNPMAGLLRSWEICVKPVIIIIEDDPITLEMLVSFFRNSIYEVRPASDGLSALSKLDENVKLIITDQEMPGLYGSDFRAMVKSRLNIPVIGITGLRMIDRDDFSKKFDGVLFKPFRLSSLRQLLDRLLSLSHEGYEWGGKGK